MISLLWWLCQYSKCFKCKEDKKCTRRSLESCPVWNKDSHWLRPAQGLMKLPELQAVFRHLLLVTSNSVSFPHKHLSGVLVLFSQHIGKKIIKRLPDKLIWALILMIQLVSLPREGLHFNPGLRVLNQMNDQYGNLDAHIQIFILR